MAAFSWKPGSRLVSRSVLVLVAALASMAAVATDASARRAPHHVGPQFFGMNAQNVLRPIWDTGVSIPHIRAIGRSGFEVVRRDAYWQAAEPKPPVDGVHSYDWRQTDSWVVRMALQGIRWQPIIDYSTTWAGRAGQLSQPEDVDSYAAYARAVADRYGRGGRFWRLYPDVPYLPVTRYEIWNEPNHHGKWRQDATAPEDFIDLYLRARAAIRAEDRRALVITGGLAIAGASYTDFTRRMLAHRPWAVRHIDAIGFHPYDHGSPDIDVVMWHIRQIRSVLDRNGARHVPLALTEIGWTTVKGVTDADRALLLARLVREMARTNCGVLQVQLHTWLTPEQDVSNGQDWFGIANDDTTLKRSGRVFVRLTRRAERRGFWGEPRFPCRRPQT